MTQENTENSVNSTDSDAAAELKSGLAADATPTDPLQDAQEKIKELDKKYLYLYSDFENFRRRAETERVNFIKFGHEGFLRDQLQVLDNFDRGIEQARGFKPEKTSPLGQILMGLEMIHYQFLESLKNQGVTELKSSGEKFNPAFHEAIAEEESPGTEAGTILKELSRGYLLHGRLLRPARVITTKKAGSTAN
jgi:molecular chaperone GrpE